MVSDDNYEKMQLNALGYAPAKASETEKPENEARNWLEVFKQIAGTGVLANLLTFVVNKLLPESKK